MLEFTDLMRHTMSGPKFFEEMQQRMAELIAQSPAKDIERNMKAMMSSAFTKIDLVPREEFDVQAKVLARTRERLEQLEQRVAELEAKLGERSPAQE
jgi:ubiquinone biosynthesis accessory factor UbiK